MGNAAASRKQPVSPEWQKDCKRNASGIMAVSFTAGFAWITASHTFVALSNGRLVHPSSIGWPLYVCIFVFIVGIYFYISAEHEQLPMPGRKYTPVDHSTKASLCYETMNINWSAPYGDASNRMAASVGIVFSNGNGTTPMTVHMEKLSIHIEGISLVSDDATHLTFILLPAKSQTVTSGAIGQIPSGQHGVKYVIRLPMDQLADIRFTVRLVNFRSISRNLLRLTQSGRTNLVILTSPPIT